MRFQAAHPQTRDKTGDERILPLINVVFLLLIFFMLAGKLAATDPIEVAPPRSASEGAVEAQELVVVIGENGDLAFDGALIAKAALQSAVAGKLTGKTPPQVWLKADSSAESVQVIAVMEILREAGVERLKLLTLPAGTGG